MPPIDVVSPRITLVIRGEAGALWCDPRTKGDPLSFPLPTPPAVEGVIRSAYHKPSIQYEIRRIGMLTAPRWESHSGNTPWHRPGVAKFDEGAMLQTTTALTGPVAWTVDFVVVEHRPDGEPDPGHPDGYVPEVLKKLGDERRWGRVLYLGRTGFPGWIELSDARVHEHAIDFNLDLGAIPLMDLPPAPRVGMPSPMPIYCRGVVRHGILDLPDDIYVTTGARAQIRTFNNSNPGMGRPLEERPGALAAVAKRKRRAAAAGGAA